MDHKRLNDSHNENDEKTSNSHRENHNCLRLSMFVV